MEDLLLAGRLISVVSGIGLLALTVHTVRTRENPVASSFAVLLGILGVAALCGGATAHSGTPYKLVWLWTTLAIPMALALFSFDYYGLPYVDSRGRAVVAVTPAALGAVGGSLVILGTPMNSPGSVAPVSELASLPGPVFDIASTFTQIGLYYTTAVVVLAVSLVARSVSRYTHLDTKLGPVIAFIGVWPWTAYIALPELLGVFPTDIALFGVACGYAGSLLAATLGVGPFGLFESTPAAGNVGPETVLDSMDDAVVVVDDQNNVLRVNAVACQTFGATPTDVVGGPLSAVVGRPLDELPTGETVAIDTVDGARTFEVTRSAIRDRTDEKRGYALVFRDVTRRQTREQRLSVLNRVLRHNLRNNATSIIGRAELISDGGDPDDSAAKIVEKTNSLVSAAERAREIETMMTASNDSNTTSVEQVLGRVVTEIDRQYPDVEITTALPAEATAAVNPVVFETVFRNIIENAAEHNDADEPIVVVSADAASGTLQFAVADNGPGIPDHEQAVLDAGREDQLQHGSGLGLWAVYWGVTRMGGELSFEENDPRGSVVTVTIPATDEATTDAAPQTAPA